MAHLSLAAAWSRPFYSTERHHHDWSAFVAVIAADTRPFKCDLDSGGQRELWEAVGGATSHQAHLAETLHTSVTVKLDSLWRILTVMLVDLSRRVSNKNWQKRGKKTPKQESEVSHNHWKPFCCCFAGKFLASLLKFISISVSWLNLQHCCSKNKFPAEVKKSILLFMKAFRGFIDLCWFRF